MAKYKVISENTFYDKGDIDGNIEEAVSCNGCFGSYVRL